MKRAVVSPARAPLQGSIRLPGDKSISHRCALMSLLVNEEVRLNGYGTGEDCGTTLTCVQALGKAVVRNGGQVVISGGAQCLSAELDCGNSGTTTRLLMGILAGQEGEWVLSGDRSLSQRPMERVAVPLRLMGADIELTDGHLPARIVGRKLQGIDYESPVPSAQVKSAVLLAGLKAKGVTRYREPLITRDHTERLLGITLDYVEWLTIDPEKIRLSAQRLSGEIPGDASAASFWIVAANLIPGSQLELVDMLANPIRLEFIRLLRDHGADIHIINARQDMLEGAATLDIASSSIKAFSVRQPETAKLIDEIPVFAVLATQLDGNSTVFDASELRLKESDRLALLCENLRAMGAAVEHHQDNLIVSGPSSLHGAAVNTNGDHRLAMAFAVAGLAATSETIIDNANCVSVSYPEFWDDLNRVAPGSVKLQ